MIDPVSSIECFHVEIPRDQPYLGNLLPGEEVDESGYFIRKANRTIYPTADKSVVVKLTTRSGCVGWGETYGLVAPGATTTLINDILRAVVIGRDPFDAQLLWEDAYDLMRVRGYTGGYYLDAMAAIDIALWDLSAKSVGLPLHKLLGGRRHEAVPAYVSGLAKATRAERMDLARDWVAKGYTAIKLHAPQFADQIEPEVAALRETVGANVEIMIDLHWMFTGPEAVGVIEQLKPYRLAFVEAPCRTEDIDGLSWVAGHGCLPVAVGEEWRTVHDAQLRLKAGAVSIVQPEMGHTGVTQFMRIARLAEANHARVAPHATIGCGIFMAASLQASASLLSLAYHEYQPTIFHRNATLMDGVVECADGYYRLSETPGIGIEPNDAFWAYAKPA